MQAQVLNTMKDLQKERGLTCLFMSHKLAVLRRVSDSVGLMYPGRLVETANKQTSFSTRAILARMLLDAIPKTHATGRLRAAVQGEVHNPLNPPPGCAFNPRCHLAKDRCRQGRPAIETIGDTKVACHAAEEGRS